MLLYLTSSEPSNTRYCNQDGEVLFKSVCPYKAKKRIATIWRALPTLRPTTENRLWAERHFIAPRPSSPLSSSSSLKKVSPPESPGPTRANSNANGHVRLDTTAPGPTEGGHTHPHPHGYAPGHTHDPLHRHPSISSSSSSHDHDDFHWENPPPSFPDFQKVAAETEIQTDFAKVAEIEFHTIASTKIHFAVGEEQRESHRERENVNVKVTLREREWTASEFFRKEGWGWYGSNRLFTGPDGKEYRWNMGSSVSELFLEDTDLPEPNVGHSKDHTPPHPRAHVPFLVARFCSPRDGILHDERTPPYLEIMPLGEHMVETILVTFIYIEEMRRLRERRGWRGWFEEKVKEKEREKVMEKEREKVKEKESKKEEREE